jgi:hypothetical protein
MTENTKQNIGVGLIALGVFVFAALVFKATFSTEVKPPEPLHPHLTLTIIAPTGEIQYKGFAGREGNEAVSAGFSSDLKATAVAKGRSIDLAIFRVTKDSGRMLAHRSFTGVGGAVSARGFVVVSDWELRP